MDRVSSCTVFSRLLRWCHGLLFQGKDLFMDLDEGSLKLVDPENLTVLNTQPIHTIRVWGVGRDNGRWARRGGAWDSEVIHTTGLVFHQPVFSHIIF